MDGIWWKIKPKLSENTVVCLQVSNIAGKWNCHPNFGYGNCTRPRKKSIKIFGTKWDHDQSLIAHFAVSIRSQAIECTSSHCLSLSYIFDAVHITIYAQHNNIIEIIDIFRIARKQHSHTSPRNRRREIWMMPNERQQIYAISSCVV